MPSSAEEFRQSFRLVLVGSLAVALVVGAAAVAATGTKLVSQTSSGDPADGDSTKPTGNGSVSRDGRYTVFSSQGSNLPGAGSQNAYARDRSGHTTLIARTSDGEPVNAFSNADSISYDGRYATFNSPATNLPGDPANSDVYIRDLELGRTRLVSRRSDGEDANGVSTHSQIAGEGRFVTFVSQADNLPGENAYRNVYVHDRVTRETQLASKTSDGVPANGDSGDQGTGTSAGPSISADGRYVAFESDAPNLPGSGGEFQAYVHDRESGTTRLISRNSAEEEANDQARDPTISGNGRYVAFGSWATNLPGGSEAGVGQQVYVRDLEGGRTRLASVAPDGDPTFGREPSISASGQQVAFTTGAGRVLVYDQAARSSRVVSRTTAGDIAEPSYWPTLSASGDWAAFTSDADNLPGDDSVTDVFLRGPLD